MGLLLLLLIIILSSAVAAQADDSQQQQQSSSMSFRPSVGIVMGIFGIMFTLTFLLLMYAKFCHTAAADLFASAVHFPDSALDMPRRNSGVDKSVIESLPFFRFSALKGSREGLECAVCLSPFEATEVLRLLPKCKHAFHIGCVDRWLERHSSCPLCRCKVDVDDNADLRISESSRWLVDDVDLELFIEREPSGRHASSSRFTIGSSFRKSIGADENENALLATTADEGGGSGEDQLLHKFKHRIIVSDVVLRSRWSDVNSSDLMSLNSDMLRVNSSQRFSLPDIVDAVVSKPRPSSDESVIKIKEEMEKKRAFESKVSMINRSCSVSVSVSATNVDGHSATDGSRSMIAPGDRSMSEITNLSRFGVGFARHRWNSGSAKDDRVRRVWLPIARRTVRWFAGRERRSLAQHPRAAMIV